MNEHLLPGDVSPDDYSETQSDSDSTSSAFGAGVEDGAPAGRKRRPRKKAAKKSKASPSATDEPDSHKGDAAPDDKARPSRGRRRSKRADSDAEPADESGESAKKKPARQRRKKSSTRKAADEAPSEASADDREASDERPRKKAGRTRRRAAKAETDEQDKPDASAGDDSDDGESPDGSRRKRRRRGSRGGRRRKSARDDDDDALAVDALPGEEDDLPEGQDSAEDETAGDKKKGRTRRSSKKKTARRSASEEGDDEADEDEDAQDSEGATRKKRRRRRRKSASERDAGDEESQDDDRDDADDESASGKTTKKKRSRSRKKKADAPEKTEEELAAEAEKLRTQTILVNAVEPEEKRVVVLEEDDRIVDLLMTAESQKTLVNDVYRGKVVNLEPAIGAAFIDFGQGRNGFLHTSDVLPMYGEDGFKIEQLLTARVDDEDWDDDERVDSKDLEDDDEGKASKKKSSRSKNKDDDSDGDDAEDGDDEKSEKSNGKKSKTKTARGKSARTRRKGRDRRPISDLLKVGDPVVVQITKDAIGDKGPTLTTYISIPGRYLVLMPSMSRTGVSRKIPDDKERRRLKRILAGLDVPEDMGVIVRTAGIGKKKVDLQRDLEYLLGVWEGFGRKLRGSRGPSPLYQESDVSTRTLRDLFNAKTKRVVVDDYSVHEQMVEFADKLMPEHRHRIELYDGDRPIFHQFGTEQDFEKVFARRVDLPSGGSIVFDQAEALVAIDVNSGRTRTDSFDFEKIALKTNLEAVPEIARQIRLRDLGGILVCDFIDMMKPSSNRQVERALRTALADDRARSKLGRISQFGLLEMTRQRLGPGTHKKVFQACPRCRGTARVRTMESRAQAILRRLGSALTQKGFSTVEVRAHPEVVQYLKEDLYDYIRAMEHRTEREIRFSSVPDQIEDSVLRYLRADGREVRPGGRRKK